MKRPSRRAPVDEAPEARESENLSAKKYVPRK